MSCCLLSNVVDVSQRNVNMNSTTTAEHKIISFHNSADKLHTEKLVFIDERTLNSFQ